ncbi:MAG: hypothetical protein KDE27_11335 [Planctomycetes bacterium]|nr:hypothetical protein [Planctomycetota bacterium]
MEHQQLNDLVGILNEMVVQQTRTADALEEIKANLDALSYEDGEVTAIRNALEGMQETLEKITVVPK